jgi:nitroimidazol reductase NimA-like FMN-containing flavoprotein (pyridoxamine 5'-phosphate oxidase superfamily)
MPKDYNLDKTPANAQRRREYVQDDGWIKEFLGRAQIGHIATRWDEQPFITPTNFWYDPERNEIYFHSNIVGRARANSERHPQVCFEAFEAGKLLPSNVALEFSIQYESVIAFGKIRVLQNPEEKRLALYGLIRKYFPEMVAGEHYRPITDGELQRTSVYAISIESWSGKRNWKDRAHQSDEWPPLGEESFRN